MEDKIRVLLTEEEVNKRISEVAEQISRDYEGKSLHLICVLKGAQMNALRSSLLEHLNQVGQRASGINDILDNQNLLACKRFIKILYNTDNSA